MKATSKNCQPSAIRRK